ncbi:hypothetical protein [Halosegnis marinus]|uniref:Small CPxCG-related zinc finger protein n=1 Tax=Halosegnis marinus TaxID=3034023 RepID=A0ABD5ZSK3_9EURY|nr:hypothetical protein [Halosegnis sp. DT85]
MTDRTTTTPGESDPTPVTCCPHCDGTDIHARTATWGAPHAVDPERRYRCYACGGTFEEPAERPPKRRASTLSGLAKRLDQLDPDAIGADTQAD